jgi:hypothetical protein
MHMLQILGFATVEWYETKAIFTFGGSNLKALQFVFLAFSRARDGPFRSYSETKMCIVKFRTHNGSIDYRAPKWAPLL